MKSTPHSCPECGSLTFVVTSHSPGFAALECVDCGERWGIGDPELVTWVAGFHAGHAYAVTTA